jgi:hypothetical protein
MDSLATPRMLPPGRRGFKRAERIDGPGTILGPWPHDDFPGAIGVSFF